MIPLSLTEWMNSFWMFGMSWLGIILGLTGLIVSYAVTIKFSAERIRSRIDRIGTSLQLYAAAESALLTMSEETVRSREDRQLLLDRLLSCRSAPYITADITAQIAAYAEDPDAARLPLLLKTLQRESERLCMERGLLLRRSERPGWGYSFWRQIRPAIPFLFIIALLTLFNWLVYLIGVMNVADASLAGLINAWSQFVSALFSLILLYPAMMDGDRPSTGYLLLRLWSILIAGLYLLNLIGGAFAPYILVLQVLLFLVGFRFTGSKPRRSRPFAGHTQEDSQESSSAPSPEPTEHDYRVSPDSQKSTDSIS